MANLLLVRFGSMGDVVLTFGAGEALKRTRPEARLTYLVKREYADLVRAQPWVDGVWELLPDEGRGPLAARALRDRIRSAGFDAAVDWQTSPRSRYLLRGTSPVHAWRAGRWARRRWVSLRFTRPLPLRPAWLRYADALKPLGVSLGTARPPRVAWSEAAETHAKRLFESWPGSHATPLVALAPGAHWPTKRWPEERYEELARSLIAKGNAVLLAGDAADRAQLVKLDRLAREEKGVNWFEGPLDALAAALSRCRVCVANDTGLMHLAAAAGVPVVALFGSTHPALGFAPAGEGHRVLSLDLSCQPCTLHGRPQCPLGHHRCMRDLSFRRVEDEVLSLLARSAVAP